MLQDNQFEIPFNADLYTRPDLPREIVEEVKAAFDFIDIKNLGVIDLVEMKQVIIALGLDGRNQNIHEIFWRMGNSNGGGTINFPQFLEMMTTNQILGNDLTQFKNYFRAQMVKRSFHILA